MKIGVYQFKGSGDIKNNLNHILNGMEKAATEQVRLTVFQECALCGYPPLEVESGLNQKSKKRAEEYILS
jgi:predicted amidohydrolase